MKLIRSLITVLILVMFAVLFNLTASAVNHPYNISTGDINISAGTGANAGKIAVNQETTTYITSSDTITISGSTTTNTIKVEPDVTGVKIILNNVSIDVSDSGNDPRYSKCAFDIGDGSSVELTLNAGTTNTFKSGVTKAGIKVETPESGIAGSVNINGTGTLIAVGGSGGPSNWASGSGAGIGSNGLIYTATTVPSGGNITINSGTINATGGIATSFAGAGIGGGGGQSYFHSQVETEANAPNAGNITIHGGDVTATGGSNQFSGAGIGGGSGSNSGTMGTVLIDGGTVTARSGNGTYIANGIGYGYANSSNLVRTNAASITITGNAVVNASSSNGTRVYAAIGHNGNQSITISGTTTVTATKGIQSSPYYSDCGTISCNNLTISDSPSITVYSQNKQGDQSYLNNSGSVKDAVRPIYANTITSSVPIIAGIFPSVPKTDTIVLSGGETPSSKTITLPANCASFATTVSSTGAYTGEMGIDVLQNSATLSQTFDLTNAVSTFNVKQLDITPPTAPGGLTAAAGPIINSQEEAVGVQVVLSLGTSGALVNDVAELLVDGQPFSTPVKHVLTAAEILANSCTITIPTTRLGADGDKVITARIIDEAGNIGPARESITLALNTVPPTAPTAVTVTPIGGTIVSNTLNLTNTNLTASALINANEAAGGSAKLYINGILKAIDDTILAEDTQVTFDLGQSTASGLQAAVETGGVVTVELYNAIGNKSISSVDNPTLIVDYTAPRIVTLGVPAPKSYKAGQNLDFTVNFNEDVTVTTGTPYIQITLDTSGTVNAYYESGSGSTTLTFRYTVTAGDRDSNGIQVSSVPVALNGSSIRDVAGNDTDLTIRGVGVTDEILVDTTAPYVVSVGVPATATYISNQNLDFTVNFNEKVTVTTGTPYIQIALDTGGTVYASYISGSGSTVLTFSYAIQPGNLDLDGIDVGTGIILNGSTIKDIAGNDALLELNDVGSTTGFKIDAVLPAMNSAVLAPDNTYVDITFSKGIYGTGALTSDKLALTFTKNDGFATGATISAIKNEDSVSALVGGETAIRVFINITETPLGLETIEIKPANAASVYDALGNAMAAGETTGVILLRDKLSPTAGDSGTIAVSDLTAYSAKLTWTAATDPGTAPANLQYKVVYSTANNIATVTDAENNGIVTKNWTSNITTATVTGLIASTDYYFNVLVKDEAGNKSLYTAVAGKTTAIAYEGGGTTSGSAVVEVDGEKQNAATFSTQTTGGQTVTTIKVDDTKLDKILESSGENAVITIPTNGNSNVVIGEMNGQTIKNMEQKAATLEIKTPTITYTLPAAQINIDDVSAQMGSQATLKDIKVSVKIAEPSADTVKIIEDTANKGSFQLVVKPVEFEITCASGDRTIEVSRFNGYVERTVAIPEGVDPSKITTGVVLNSDGTFSHVPTTIVKIDGKYYAKISSLTNSTYSIIWNPVTFADLENHWAKDAINDMGSRMIVSGVGNSLYEPDRYISRAEFASIIVKALGLKQGTTESAFDDVTLTDWFNGYVHTATAYALITGYDNTSYGPSDAITREQAMTIIARAMKLTGLSVSLTDSESSALLAKYTDGASVSEYAKTRAAICLKTGVVTGSSTTALSPKAYVTRAEVAVMVQRLLQKSGLI